MKKLVIFLMFPFFLMLGCSKDNSNNTTPTVVDKPFANVPDVEDMVVYEVNTLVFSKSSKLTGVTEKLDSIKNLGVNVIWLMPIYPVGSYNSPYEVTDYYTVNPDFGTLSTLKTLVSTAHEKNMAVILDWAANKTSDENDWFIIHKDWYKQATATYFYAELNYGNNDMRAAMISAMKYWVLNANVDGFRCNAADQIPYDFWKQAIDSLNALPGRKLIFLGEGTNASEFTAGFQMNYGSSFCETLKNIFKQNAPASEVFSADNAEYSGMPTGKHKLRYITNQEEYFDNTPITNYNGVQGSVAAFVVTSLLNGVPLIYNGQEISCPLKLSYYKSNFDRISWDLNQDVHSQYKKIMAARESVSAFRGGSIASFYDNDVVVFRRIGVIDEALVIVNVRDKKVNYTVPDWLVGATYTDRMTNAQVTLSNNLGLDAYQYLILSKNRSVK